ncbi:MAG: hypothetical protein WD734_04180 [Dehalococcoidia bacterium]
MPYIRVSYMVPHSGQDGRVAEVLEKLSARYLDHQGYIQGYFLEPHPEAAPPRFGRVGIWESDRDAEDAAQDQDVMALRAELIRLVDEDSHIELSFVGDADRQ